METIPTSVNSSLTLSTNHDTNDEAGSSVQNYFSEVFQKETMMAIEIQMSAKYIQFQDHWESYNFKTSFFVRKPSYFM